MPTASGIRKKTLIKSAPDKLFRDLVLDAMKKQDQTVQSVANGCKIGRPTLSRWLNSSRRLYAEDLARVFDYLDLRVSAYSGKSKR